MFWWHSSRYVYTLLLYGFGLPIISTILLLYISLEFYTLHTYYIMIPLYILDCIVKLSSVIWVVLLILMVGIPTLKEVLKQLYHHNYWGLKSVLFYSSIFIS